MATDRCHAILIQLDIHFSQLLPMLHALELDVIRAICYGPVSHFINLKIKILDFSA